MHLTIDYATLKELSQKLEDNTLNRDAFIKLIEAAKKLGLELQPTDHGDSNMSIPFILVGAGYLEMFKLLFSFGDVDVNSKFSGLSLLHKAAGTEEGHEDIVKMLLSRPDIDVNAEDEYGQTPLHRATGNLKIVKLLLEHPEIDIDATDSEGETPLFFPKNAKTAQILLESGANPNVIDNDGETPLTRACREREFDHVRVLLENGADPLIGEESALEWCDKDEDKERGKAKRALVQEYIDRGASGKGKGKGKKRRKLK